MKRISKNQKGFSLIEGLLMILILVIIGAVGYMVYYNNHKTVTVSVTKSSSTNPTKPTSVKTTTAVVSNSSVTQLVNTFYNQYIACLSGGNLNQTCTTNLVKQDGTANLYSYYKPSTGTYPADPITCAQDNPPSITVSGVTIATSGASGIVIENFTTPSNVKFTVVSQSGNPKIDTITCDPPLVAQQGSE